MFVWGPQKRGILAFLSQKDMGFWQRWVQINLLFGWSQINQLVFFILCIFFERINWTHIFPWPNRIPYIGTYPFHPQTIHPWALILSFTSYKFQLYKIIPYSLAYAYHTFSVILYYIDSFHFILYLSSSPFHTFEFIFLMPYYYFSSL